MSARLLMHILAPYLSDGSTIILTFLVVVVVVVVVVIILANFREIVVMNISSMTMRGFSATANYLVRFRRKSIACSECGTWTSRKSEPFQQSSQKSIWIDCLLGGETRGHASWKHAGGRTNAQWVCNRQQQLA